jgi:hypothetical protein
MNRFRWILAAGLVLAAACAWVVGSCAIDDEVTWITGERCTGACTAGSADDYSCDVDSSCTATAGCVDWDCNEAPASLDDGDTDVEGTPPDGGDWSGGGDGGDGDDVPPDPTGCAPFGGGADRAAAQSITLGVPVSELSSCPATSQWFRFQAESGAQFVVDLRPVEGGQLTFLLYAGDDPTPIASADMSDTGSFEARAGATTDYYLRIRALGETPVFYAMTVSLAVP